MLGCHPKVFAAGELTDFVAPVRTLQEKTEKPFPEMVPCMTNDELHALGSEYMRRVGARAPDAERIVDEMPGNYLYLGLIHLTLPNARIVHMMRDPLDNCMACFSKLFATGHPYSYDLG